jgi:hypothetical protein
VAIAALAVAAIAAGGVVGWRLLGPEAPPTAVPSTATAPVSCPDPTPVSVAAAPSVAPMVAALADLLSSHEDGPCAAFTIESAEAFTVAGIIGTAAEPDAWVSDSAGWVSRAQSLADRELTVQESFASTGIVVALPRESADQLGNRATWSTIVTGSTPIRFPDPNRSALGAATLGAAAASLAPERIAEVVRANVATPPPDLAAAAQSETPVGVVVPAAHLVAFNESSADEPLAALAPVEGAPFLQYSLATVTEEPEVAQLVADFGAYLAMDEAKDALSEAGFTTPDGPEPQVPTPLYGIVTAKPAPEPAVLQNVRAAWSAAAPRKQVLLALDVSGSMLRRTDQGTRLAVMQQAAFRAVSALPARTRLALWAYSLHIGTKGDDFRPLLNPAPVGETAHLLDLRAQITGLDRSVGGGSGLYDTIVAAYQRAQSTFAKGHTNSVVIVTDGPNEDDYGASFDVLMDRIKKLRDPARPIRVDIIGFGTEPDAKAMTSIAALTGGRYVSAAEPDDLIKALSGVLGG